MRLSYSSPGFSSSACLGYRKALCSTVSTPARAWHNSGEWHGVAAPVLLLHMNVKFTHAPVLLLQLLNHCGTLGSFVWSKQFRGRAGARAVPRWWLQQECLFGHKGAVGGVYGAWGVVCAVRLWVPGVGALVCGRGER